MKQPTVEAGKTYWGVYWDELKRCTILEVPHGGYCDVHVRRGRDPSNKFTWCADGIRNDYPYATKRAAQKALVRVLTKDADKAFTAWNKLADRLRKAKETLDKL